MSPATGSRRLPGHGLRRRCARPPWGRDRRPPALPTTACPGYRRNAAPRQACRQRGQARRRPQKSTQRQSHQCRARHPAMSGSDDKAPGRDWRAWLPSAPGAAPRPPPKWCPGSLGQAFPPRAPQGLRSPKNQAGSRPRSSRQAWASQPKAGPDRAAPPRYRQPELR